MGRLRKPTTAVCFYSTRRFPRKLLNEVRALAAARQNAEVQEVMFECIRRGLPLLRAELERSA